MGWPIWNRIRRVHPQCAGRERVLGVFGLSSQVDLPCNRIQLVLPATTFHPVVKTK